MLQDARALQLIQIAYAAALDSSLWDQFAEELGEAFGDAAIAMGLQLPGVDRSVSNFHSAHLGDEYRPIFEKFVLQGLPWGSLDDEIFRDRFDLANNVLSQEELVASSFYSEFMEPQGLAPEVPVCHLMQRDDGIPLAGICIFRRVGGRAFRPDDFALGDLLVPHLACAYEIHARLSEAKRERVALGEVLDRLPTGVLLIDAKGRPVVVNRAAQSIIALKDGFSVRDERCVLDDCRENAVLHKLIAKAVESARRGERVNGDVITVTRPSRARSYALMVGPLLEPSPGSTLREAVGVIFIADPEAGTVTTTEVLEALYSLTHAEAELVRLLSEGRGLDEVAALRGVTMNTVRSQLKQAFSKTDTKRQGELVGLVLSGVASVRDEPTQSAD